MSRKKPPVAPSMQQQAAAVLAAYQAARAAGKAITPQAVLREHPELADLLRPLLAVRDDSAQGETLDHPAAAQSTASMPAVSKPPARQPSRAGTPTKDRPPASAAAAPRKPAAPQAPTLDHPKPPGQAPAASHPTDPLPKGKGATRKVRVFGDYVLLEEIARGGMGVVFTARQRTLNRVVALKMILAGKLATADQVRRFRIEAEQAGRLDHPHIVPIYQVGEHNGQHYYSMKLIGGGSLADLCPWQKGPRAGARLVMTVALAVHYAHQRGVLHRDIKPANILMDKKGQPHVADFGLAKHLGGTGKTDTQSGAIVGTPGYMSPEQAAARKDLSTASDVYSLGAILYELLTGQAPFHGVNSLETLLQVLEKEPIRPRKLRPTVPRDLETLCLKCLHKSPERRYPSAREMAEDLQRWLNGEPTLARPASRTERVVKWMRRRPWAAALLAVSTLAVLALTLGGWWYNVRLQGALAEANQQRERAEAGQKEIGHQRDLAEANFQKRSATIDDMLIRVDGRLAKLANMGAVRREFLDEFRQRSLELLQEKPDDPAVRRQAGRVYHSLGDLQRQARLLKEAEEAFQKALPLQEKLAQQFPTNPDYRNDVARTEADWAELLQSRRQFRQAETRYRHAIQLQDQLAGEVLTDPAHRLIAARYRFLLANLLEEADKPAEAATLYREALERQEKLAGDRPDLLDAHAELATTANSLAVLLGEDDAAGTQALLERAVQVRRRVRELAPSVTDSSRRLRDSYVDLGAWLKKHGRHAELAKMADDYRRDFPDGADDTYTAARFLANATRAAWLLTGSERERLADIYGSRSVALLRKAVQAGYSDRARLDRDPHLDTLRERADYKALLADLDKDARTEPPSPDQQLRAVMQEYSTAQAAYNGRRAAARTVADRKKAEAARPRFPEYAERILQLAEKHPESPGAVSALAWILSTPPAEPGTKSDNATQRLRERALRVLERDHLEKPEIADACLTLAQTPTLAGDRLLRMVAENHSQPKVRGLSTYALALSLGRQALEANAVRPARAAELSRLSERQFEEVIRQYAAVPLGRTTLGEAARAQLHTLRFLTVGRPAPEIEGTDAEGRPMKLSDYRGKVVVLDFWANWCGYCRQEYHHHKEMVQRLQGRPFVLLGVNCDDSRAQARQAEERENLNWRSWWDGAGGRIAADWQIRAFPTIFVLDHKGVIRYRNVRGAQVDAAVEQLLKEQESARARKW